MKMTIVANKKGEVLSAYAHPARPKKDDPVLHIEPMRNQVVHEIDVPEGYAKLASVEQLHRELSEHLKKHKPKGR